MKSPLRKFRDFALNKQGLKQETSHKADEAPSKDLEKFIQDILRMKEKYDDLLGRGQFISSSAYDFSSSLEDMANFMSEEFGEVFEAEVGNLFHMLAKVQYEISKLLCLFASHVSQTLVKPFSNMLDQIKDIETQKLMCDHRRTDIQFEKSKVKHKKGKGQSPYQQLKLDEEKLRNTVQSIWQSHIQNIVEQTAKYHVAQRMFLRKALLSVEAISPEVEQLAEHKKLDLSLPEELPTNDNDMNDDMTRSRHRDESEHNSTASSPRNTMGKTSFSSSSSGELAFVKTPPDSKSAPLSAAADEVYALPSPTGIWTKPAAGMRAHRMGDFGVYTPKEYHSANIAQAYQADHNFHRDNKQHLLGNSHGGHATKVPHDDYDYDNDDDDIDITHVSVGKKRYSHSGPFFPSYSNKSPSHAMEGHGNTSPLYRSGPVSKSPVRMPNVASSPQISELHKLPLPPEGLTTPPRSPSRVAFSAPLGRKVQVQEVSLKSSPASPLPLPPGITRSLSIPSSSIQVE